MTLSIQTAGPDDVANAADLATRMGRLPGVRHVARFVALNAAPLAPDGSPRLTGLGQVRPLRQCRRAVFLPGPAERPVVTN